MNEEYVEYLRSAEWREKRKEFLEFVGYECEECGSKEKLQIHHLHYNTVGDESQDDVEVLCKICHEDKEMEKEKEIYYGSY